MARDCQAILRWREASGLDRAARVAVLAVLVLSLVLRVLNLDAFLAGDESKWFCRSLNFRNALVTGNLRETCQSEHPGVVTMWLGTAATSLGEAGPWVDYCLDMGGNKLTRVDSNAELLRLPGLIGRGRLAIALFTWCGIVVAWLNDFSSVVSTTHGSFRTHSARADLI